MMIRRLGRLILVLSILLGSLPWEAQPAAAAELYLNPGNTTTYGFQYPITAWPAENAWVAYTYSGQGPADPANQDPSNGGTAPQNYVNVSSGCPDGSEPSIRYYFDPVTETFFFRWRVRQIANTYGTGPNAGSHSASDPWNSALWTVFFDVNGDGWRDFAVHINGSSGSPSNRIDEISVIYGSTQNQSLDYVNDSNIHLLASQNTAIIANDSSRLVNFQNSLNPTSSWPNGAAETAWDYGSTRSMNISTPGCTEYLIDYQFPLYLMNASAYGGPVVTADTPIALFFATANSLQNPLQKDAVYQGSFTADPNAPIPFGDPITPSLPEPDQPPVVLDGEAIGCGPVELTTHIMDAHWVVTGTNIVSTTVTNVWFEYWHDVNENGLLDETAPITWTHAATATLTPGTLNEWTAQWDNSNLLKGSYIIRIVAQDRDGNIRTSDSPENLGGVITLNSNFCGIDPPSISKAVEPEEVTGGDVVTFTLTVHNTVADPTLSVNVITDTLPSGFTYIATVGGTLQGAVTGLPTLGDATPVWEFDPAAQIPVGESRTLVFTAQSPTAAGTYANIASTGTSWGVLTSEPVAIGVGAPRLTLAKSGHANLVNPGDLLTYTITYANDSPINVTNAIISDVLPDGLELAAVLDGGSFDGTTLTWNVGDLPSGEGPLTVRFVVTVTAPYPDHLPNLMVNRS